MDGARMWFGCQASNESYLISFPVMNESTYHGGRMATRLVDSKWSTPEDTESLYPCPSHILGNEPVNYWVEERCHAKNCQGKTTLGLWKEICDWATGVDD